MDSAPKQKHLQPNPGVLVRLNRLQLPRLPLKGMDKGTVQNAALENNSEISMARKTGKVDQYTKALSKFGLSEEQTLRFYELGENAKSNLLVEKSENVGRLLSIKDFGPETADLFFAYSPGTREKILGLEDGAMVALIHQGIDEILLSESLTKMNLERSNSSNVPAAPANPDPLEARKLALGESLIANNNERLLEEWTELAGDDLSEDWLRSGKWQPVFCRIKHLMELNWLRFFKPEVKILILNLPTFTVSWNWTCCGRGVPDDCYKKSGGYRKLSSPVSLFWGWCIESDSFRLGRSGHCW